MKVNNFKHDNEDSNEILTMMENYETCVNEGIGSAAKQDCLIAMCLHDQKNNMKSFTSKGVPKVVIGHEMLKHMVRDLPFSERTSEINETSDQWEKDFELGLGKRYYPSANVKKIKIEETKEFEIEDHDKASSKRKPEERETKPSSKRSRRSCRVK